MEVLLGFELATLLGTDPLDTVIFLESKRYRVDIKVAPWNLVIEVDGFYYHVGREESDRSKQAVLASAGWTVLRLRESPLPLHNPSTDLAVASLAPSRVNVLWITKQVLRHAAARVSASASDQRVEQYLERSEPLARSAALAYLDKIQSPLKGKRKFPRSS